MANIDFTPKDPSALHTAMHNGGKRMLQDICKAAYAIEAASRLLQERNDDNDIVNDYVAGGLEVGINILSNCIQSDTNTLLRWLGADAWSDLQNSPDRANTGGQ